MDAPTTNSGISTAFSSSDPPPSPPPSAPRYTSVGGSAETLTVDPPPTPTHPSASASVFAPPHTPRNVFFRVGAISRAQGSCFAEVGDTKVMVGVYGPRQSSRFQGYSDHGHLACDVRYTPFAHPHRHVDRHTLAEKRFASNLAKALTPAVHLESFPKSTVDVFVSVLEADGNELAVAVAAASLALADAGVEMRGLVSSCAVTMAHGRLLIDATSIEEANGEGTVALTVVHPLRRLSSVQMTGQWSQGAFQDAVYSAVAAAERLGDAMRDVLVASAPEPGERPPMGGGG